MVAAATARRCRWGDVDRWLGPLGYGCRRWLGACRLFTMWANRANASAPLAASRAQHGSMRGEPVAGQVCRAAGCSPGWRWRRSSPRWRAGHAGGAGWVGPPLAAAPRRAVARAPRVSACLNTPHAFAGACGTRWRWLLLAAWAGMRRRLSLALRYPKAPATLVRRRGVAGALSATGRRRRRRAARARCVRTMACWR